MSEMKKPFSLVQSSPPTPQEVELPCGCVVPERDPIGEAADRASFPREGPWPSANRDMLVSHAAEKHLGHLDEVAKTFFAGDRAKEAVRLKVEALFPEHEWEEFTEHFWSRIQVWRQTEGAM